MKTCITAIALAVTAFAVQINAQTIIMGSGGPRVVPGCHGHVHYPPAVSSVSPSFDAWGNPVGPAFVTGNQFNGFNSSTGGVDTFNEQIDHSAFRPGRDDSRFNGTERYVERPIYDNFGNVVGYQQGYVWNNSFTGEEHGDLTNYTPNGMGGVHQQSQTKSARPGVHTQRQSYSGRGQ